MLVLPIKKKWFDLILSGEKKEEYREIKPYYTKRFRKVFSMIDCIPLDESIKEIEFRNGYGKNMPAFIADCHLEVGTGEEKWGAVKGVTYYILVIEKIRWKSTDNLGGFVSRREQ